MKVNSKFLASKNTKITAYIFLGLIIFSFLAYGLYYYFTSNNEGRGIIEGSGIVEGNSVVISSQVSGLVEQLLVAEGDKVQKGQKIAKISAEGIEAKVRQAHAQVKLAEAQIQSASAALEAANIEMSQSELTVELTKEDVRSQITRAVAGVEMARSNLKEAKIAYEDAGKNYERLLALFEAGAVSTQELEKGKLALDISKAKYAASENQLKQAQALLQLAQSLTLSTEVKKMTGEKAHQQVLRAQSALSAAKAQKELALASLEEVEALLKDTEIVAPINGTVSLKLINSGELINQGAPIVELVDLTKLDLTIYVTAQDIVKLTLGQEAEISVDSFADKFFKGKVVYIADQAEFTPKNVHMKEDRVKQVYGVKIQLENAGGILKPGMPADAILRVGKN